MPHRLASLLVAALLLLSANALARPAPQCDWVGNFQDLVEHPIDAPIPIDARIYEIGGDLSYCGSPLDTAHVTVLGPDTLPISGALALPPGSDRLIWVPAAPLAPTTTYAVTAVLTSVSMIGGGSDQTFNFSVTTASEAVQPPPSLDYASAVLGEWLKVTSECCTPSACLDPRCENCWPTAYDYLPRLELTVAGLERGVYPAFYLHFAWTDETGPVLEHDSVEASTTLSSPRPLSYPTCIQASLRYAATGADAVTLPERCFAASELVPLTHEEVPPPPEDPCPEVEPVEAVEAVDDDDSSTTDAAEVGAELGGSESSDDCGCSLQRQPAAPLGGTLLLAALLLLGGLGRARGRQERLSRR